MPVIFYLLFNSYQDSVYPSLLYSFRLMIDLMNGSYDRSVIYGDINYVQNYLSILDILISKIMLVNLIVALFMTTFQMMYAKGDFVCKSYRYEYIDRYQQALEDSWDTLNSL